MAGDPVLKELEQLWRLFQKTCQQKHGCLLLLASLSIPVTVLWGVTSSVCICIFIGPSAPDTALLFLPAFAL